MYKSLELEDLRHYLNEIREHYSDEFYEISETIDPEYEATAWWRELIKFNNPILFFQHVRGYDMHVVANVFGTLERVARMIGAKPSNIYDVWIEKTKNTVNPVIVDDGPVKENIYSGSNVNVFKLPVLKFFREDGGHYITSGIVVANDPETGLVNLSFARMVVKEPNKLGLSIHSRGNLWHYYQKAVRNGLPWLDAAVVIGCHPTIYLAAATRKTDEYKLAGALSGSPVDLVRCETKDIYVPAHSEIVLEGRILTGVTEDEGPFSEFTGYVSGRSTRNVMHVDCITKRHDSIYQTIIPSKSSEHLLLGGLPFHAAVYAKLKESIPQVCGVNFPLWGTHFVAVISVDKHGKEGVQIRAALRLIGEDPYVKYVIVVDNDVDVYDDFEVLWAVATRSQPNKNIHVIDVTDGSMLDPSQEKAGLSSRAIIDATKPPHMENIAVPSIPENIMEKIRTSIKKSSTKL
jgi:2,5-furandicarboxylate decarboxylase 1